MYICGVLDENLKPPLGLLRRSAWTKRVRNERIGDIIQAMGRYSNAGKPVPDEWLSELNDLIAEAINDRP